MMLSGKEGDGRHQHIGRVGICRRVGGRWSHVAYE